MSEGAEFVTDTDPRCPAGGGLAGRCRLDRGHPGPHDPQNSARALAALQEALNAKETPK